MFLIRNSASSNKPKEEVTENKSIMNPFLETDDSANDYEDDLNDNYDEWRLFK